MNASQIYESLSKNTLAKFFLTANLIVSTIIFSWSDFFAYISKIGGSGCKPLPPPISSKISFGIYDIAGRYSDLEFILGAALVVFSVLYLPSYLLTFVVVGAMKNDYPHWCSESFGLIFVPVFCIINSLYLVCLAQLAERIHDFYCENKSDPDKPLSIYPN